MLDGGKPEELLEIDACYELVLSAINEYGRSREDRAGIFDFQSLSRRIRETLERVGVVQPDQRIFISAHGHATSTEDAIPPQFEMKWGVNHEVEIAKLLFWPNMGSQSSVRFNSIIGYKMLNTKGTPIGEWRLDENIRLVESEYETIQRARELEEILDDGRYRDYHLRLLTELVTLFRRVPA